MEYFEARVLQHTHPQPGREQIASDPQLVLEQNRRFHRTNHRVTNRHASFDAELTCLVIFAHGCGQTSGVRGFTTTVDGAGEELADVLEKLRFCSGRVSDNADVKITSELDAVHGVFLDTTEELEQDALLDVEVTPDSRSDRVCQLGVEIVRVLHLEHGVLLSA